MAELRSHGIVRDPERFENRSAGPHMTATLGYNYRITDLQAVPAESVNVLMKSYCLNRQLKCCVKLLASLPVQLLEVPEDVLSSVHLAVIRLKNASAQQHRRVFEELRSAGIGVQLHYSPVHLHPFYREMGFKEGQFPESESYARSAISLPLFPGLSLLDQQRVVDQLGKALKQANLA